MALAKFHYSQDFKNKSRLLRRRQTYTESFLWNYLRSRRMEGYKFYRQFPVGNYILDFYCPEKKLAIELDGGQHMTDKQLVYDNQRKNYLKKQGIKILRFWDNEVFQNKGDVLEMIFKSLK